MGFCETDEVALVIDAKRLWPRVRGQFRDPRLRGLQEDLEHAGLERVLKDKATLTQLAGADREAGLVRALKVGALDEARRTTGSNDSHVRGRHHQTPLTDRHLEQAAGEDPTIAARELLDELNLTGEERVIAGCYLVGARNPRDIAHILDKPVAYITDQLRTLLPYMRGMLAKRIAPDLDEHTQQLITRYAQGDLDHWRQARERHNAQRLIANNPDCTRLFRVQRAADDRLRILLPLPALAGLHTHHAASHGTHGLRQQLVDAIATARRHAHNLYTKVDPTPIAGVRPGAAATIIAGCLTVAGGGYCATQAINPLNAINPAPRNTSHHHAKRPAHHQPRAAQVLADSIPTPQLPAASAPPASSHASTTPTPASAPPAANTPPPSPRDEFTPEAPSNSTSSATQASSAPSRPAPAPTNGPGEFGP